MGGQGGGKEGNDRPHRERTMAVSPPRRIAILAYAIKWKSKGRYESVNT